MKRNRERQRGTRTKLADEARQAQPPRRVRTIGNPDQAQGIGRRYVNPPFAKPTH